MNYSFSNVQRIPLKNKKDSSGSLGGKWQMSNIFVKTQKGIEEIEKRASDMSLRVRRILILVDGKRSVEDIRALALADDLNQTLAQLEKAGYIEPIKQPDSGSLITRIDGGLPENFTFRALPATPDPKDLEMAKHFILNTLYTFCGQWAHLSIVTAASAATTHEELRKCFIPWYNAIVETGEGKRRAGELSSSLLKVI
jgi:hypothetical protein